ncbi:MAG: HEPN domain-containing protein, partial [Archaeoglobaceae archaeon]|nr:HEPN domain-containing protein [Archaeoglobaceae archaeon]
MKEKPRFVLFFTEQALQLYIKYILAKTMDDYPKTHNSRVLFQILSQFDSKAVEFYDEHSDVLDLIEESYITARYIGKEY